MTDETITTNTKGNAVLRAADELRRGHPVLVTSETHKLHVTPTELITETQFVENPGGFILVTRQRALSLNIAPEDWNSVRVARESWTSVNDVWAIADPTRDLATPMKGPYKRLSEREANIDDAIVQLLKIADLLPSAYCVSTSKSDDDLLSISAEDIEEFPSRSMATFTEVARANVPLADSHETQLVSFRSSFGGPEHMAIIIGNPKLEAPVLTRLHSECFTGDLLGSLKCDCGEQLRGAINYIEKNGGGILLYLAQEGRGIGLVAKLKAYQLQEDGYDTVDANTRLGFEVDERAFSPAAKILQVLNVKSVKLLTNNPMKVAGLEAEGIIVAERIEHKFPTNPHNEAYLAVKKTRTGHIL